MCEYECVYLSYAHLHCNSHTLTHTQAVEEDFVSLFYIHWQRRRANDHIMPHFHNISNTEEEENRVFDPIVPGVAWAVAGSHCYIMKLCPPSAVFFFLFFSWIWSHLIKCHPFFSRRDFSIKLEDGAEHPNGNIMRRNIIIHKLVRLRISIHSIGLVECQAAMDDDAWSPTATIQNSIIKFYYCRIYICQCIENLFIIEMTCAFICGAQAAAPYRTAFVSVMMGLLMLGRPKFSHCSSSPISHQCERWTKTYDWPKYQSEHRNAVVDSQITMTIRTNFGRISVDQQTHTHRDTKMAIPMGR